MEFFPEPPPPPFDDDAYEDPPQPVWSNAPDDVLPGVVPLELILGRSQSAVVMVTGVRGFPTGLAMSLGVRIRGKVRRHDLNAEVFDGPYTHDRDPDWQTGRLKWGFELADGRRATNVDPPAWDDQPDHDHSPHDAGDRPWQPDRPVLNGGGGGGSRRSVDRDYWLWPLPPAGQLKVVCQWLDQGIEATVHELDAQPFLDAAARAQPVWPTP